MFLLRVTAALAKARVPYGLVGGYAVALHGAVRGTMDIDLVIRLEEAQFVRAERALRSIGLRAAPAGDGTRGVPVPRGVHPQSKPHRVELRQPLGALGTRRHRLDPRPRRVEHRDDASPEAADPRRRPRRSRSRSSDRAAGLRTKRTSAPCRRCEGNHETASAILGRVSRVDPRRLTRRGRALPGRVPSDSRAESTRAG